MSNYKNSLVKDLRKQKKLIRDILCLKSKSDEELNDDQKAKLTRENTVNRTINSLKNKINRLNKPTPTQTPKPVQKNKNKNNKKNKKNKKKMTNSQLAAYNTHNERSKIERKEQKNKNMLRKNKIAKLRSVRREQEETIGYLRMLMYLMNRKMEQTEQATRAIQEAIELE